MSYNALRAVANRLSTSPTDVLPRYAGYFAASIASCADALQNSEQNNENSVVIHRLKTCISSLLQDRTPDGRLTGAIVVKALIEHGGTAILSESGRWVRSLISCLSKDDSSQAMKIYVLAVTRIYVLTLGQQALIRDITTPTLPAFISATLTAIKPSSIAKDGRNIRALSPLLEVVLKSWQVLTQDFASTFRPSLNAIKSICLSLASDHDCPDSVKNASLEMLARLHYCAPKTAVASEWSQIFSNAIEAAHDTADLVFRAVIEDWLPATTRSSKMSKKQRSAATPSTSGSDVLGLDQWSGVSEGSQMLVHQIDLLKHLLICPNPQGINHPLGPLLELTGRLAAVSTPTTQFSLRTNNEITRDEREELWLNLPRIHCAVLRLFQSLAKTYGSLLTPVAYEVTKQFWNIFEAEHNDDTIRVNSYILVRSLLPTSLIEASKQDSANWKTMIDHCCTDLLSPRTQKGADQLLKIHGSSTSWPGTPAGEPGLGGLTVSMEAYKLLSLLFSFGKLHKLTGHKALRTQMDRTAILINHAEAILASVLYPSSSAPNLENGYSKPRQSCLPFLVRLDVGSISDIATTLATEALLRPRMPPIQSSQDISNAQVENMDEPEGPVDDNPIELTNNSTRDEDLLTSNNDLIHQNKPIAGDQALQSHANAQKRDFTALLEQSTDEQLAKSASAMKDHQRAMEEISTEPSSIKRQRIEEQHDILADPAKMTETENSQITTERQSPDHAAIDATRVFPTITDNVSVSMLANNPTVEQGAKGKEKIRYESDDSSDSSIPPIDATLVGMSDSEDDELQQ